MDWIKKMFCKFRGYHVFTGPIYEAGKNGQEPCGICSQPIRSLRSFKLGGKND